MWIMNLFAGLFAAFAVGGFNFILLVYPLYTVILNVSVLMAIFFGSTRILVTNATLKVV